AVGCPALILSDVVAGDEFGRQELDRGSGLLAVENADTELHGPARHEEGILRGGRLDLRRCGILERGFDIRRAIDRCDDDPGAALLARGKIGADGLRVVDSEYRIDLGEAGQVALRDRQPALARALAVLVTRENLDTGILGQDILAAGDTIDHGGHLRAVFDDDVAFAAELVDNVLAGDL